MDTDTPHVPQAASVPPLLRDSSLYFAGNFVTRATSLAMIRFYSYHLTPAEYGILNLVELLSSIVAIVFGLQSIGQTLVRAYHDQRDAAARRAVVSTVLLTTLFFAIAVGALAAMAAEPMAALINLPGQAGLLRASFAAMVFGTVAEVVLSYHRMRNRARLFLVYSMVTLAATIGLNIWFIGGLHFGIWGFVSSKLLITGAGSVLLLGAAIWEVGVSFNRRILSGIARFGGPLVLSSVSYFAIHFSDRLFLARVSSADVGIYSFAYNFAFLLSILVGDSFGKSWNVTFYNYAESAGWQARFVGIGAWLILVLGAAAVGISVFGRDILALVVNPAYLPPLLMLPTLVFGYFFREIGDFFRNILLIDIGSGLVGRIALGSAVLNVALNIMLIDGVVHWGIWGATLATAITWVVYCATCWIAAARLHAVEFSIWPLARMAVLAVGALAVHGRYRAANPRGQILADAGWMLLFGAGAWMIYLDAHQRAEALMMARTALRQYLPRR
jgi:O-antigen/teichoic acid export membrane protein